MQRGVAVDFIETFDWRATLSHLIALAIAYVLALPIGWNREKEERSAGVRTFPLVAMAPAVSSSLRSACWGRGRRNRPRSWRV